MTEVASLLPNNHRLTSVKHYEAGPPEGLELVEPGETFATTKEEEWISKKKTEVLNTKQIETRVKRQVVLEDGKVVEDSGPMVTTNTTEDTETQEHHQTELRKVGDDDVDGPRALEGDNAVVEKSNWVAASNSDGIVREVKERRVVSREETEEVKETEDVQHLGDITDEDFLAAVNSGRSDIRSVLRSSEAGRALVSTGPRVIRDTSKGKKVTDTEDTRELSSVLAGGKIVTETQRTTEHEEVDDDDLPEDAPDQNYHKESTQRYLKTREQEDVDYLSNGKNIKHEMKYKTETMEIDKRGDDDMDLFDSLSTRAKKRVNNRQPHRYRGLENGIQSPLDRKDALTRRPLDFDAEEETRKHETSKWLEHHFGSESRSSNSTVDDEEQPPKTSFFNVTIKSQPIRTENQHRNYVGTVNNSTSRVYSPIEPERDRNQSGYYKGISEWSERRQEQQHHYTTQKQSPLPYRHSPTSPYQDRPSRSPIPDYIRSTSPDYRRQYSPIPDYRNGHSPSPDYGRPIKISQSPIRDFNDSPNSQRAQKTLDRRDKYVERSERRTRYDSGYRSTGRLDDYRDDRIERLEEPPPDYSPPTSHPFPREDKKQYQKTRFAADTPSPKAKSGNIIGKVTPPKCQSFRKLVNKIRSASAERKAKHQRAKRSPSPSYQPGHVIDNNISHSMDKPVQRYYLGEDPFGGSIYGRENKYDGVKPARMSRRSRDEDRDRRSQSTLGRFSKSTSRLVSRSAVDEERSSQTLPRHPNKYESLNQNKPLNGNYRSNSTINVSIINTVTPPRIVNDGPVKPARTYKSNLARSKSLIVHGDTEPCKTRSNMYTSNSNIYRLNDNPSGLKSPGLISSLNRSHKDLNNDSYTSRFQRNGDCVDSSFRAYPDTTTDNRRVYISELKSKSPNYFKTINGDDEDWRIKSYNNATLKSSSKNFNGTDVYEPPTRLREPTSHIISTPSPSHSVLRRGSASSTDFSETYHTTTRNDDPRRPSITNTVKTISKKTIPNRNGRGVETIESSETKSITKSHYRSGNRREPPPSVTFFESEKRYDSTSSRPVVIEVRRS